MTIRLKITLTTGSTHHYEFERAKISVGRGPLNTITIDDESIPRHIGDFVHLESGAVEFQCHEADGSVAHLREEVRTASDDVDKWELVPGDQIVTGNVIIDVEGLEVANDESVHWLDLPEFEPEPRVYQALVDSAEKPGVGAVLRSIDKALKDNGHAPDQLTLVMARGKGQFARDAFRLVDHQAVRCSDPLRALGESGLGFASKAQEGRYALANKSDGAVLFVPIHEQGELIAAVRASFSASDSKALLDAARVTAQLKPIITMVLAQEELTAQLHSVQAENAYFRERERRHYLFKELIVESLSMREVYQKLTDHVEENTPVLIVGEAGSGKELLARAVHHLGPRKDEMMISQNCGSLSGPEIDLELFGSISNGFTGVTAPRKGVVELAGAGTVYLEEIDLLSPLVQGKISRMLTEKEIRRVGDSVGRPVSARIVCSIHRDLDFLVDSGRMRKDLYLNLKDYVLRVPPLRERREDIMPLARIFLRNFR